MSTNAPEFKRSDLRQYDPTDVEIVGLDTPDDNGHYLSDSRIAIPASELEFLVRNLATLGQAQPILIEPIKGGKPRVIDGRQRVRALRILNARNAKEGLPAIPVLCAVRTGANDKTQAALVFSANEIRIEDAPLDKALKAARLADVFKFTNKEIAEFAGVTPTSVGQWRQVAGTHSSVHEALRQGAISFSAALELSRAPLDQQGALLADLLSAAGVVLEAPKAPAEAPQSAGEGEPAGEGASGGSEGSESGSKAKRGRKPRQVKVEAVKAKRGGKIAPLKHSEIRRILYGYEQQQEPYASLDGNLIFAMRLIVGDTPPAAHKKFADVVDALRSVEADEAPPKKGKRGKSE